MTNTCDNCNHDVTGEGQSGRIVDGKTKFGPWAWMCEPCHKRIGCGLGTGKGQLYDARSGRKLDG